MKKSIDTPNKDVDWNEENKLADLDFADDIVLTTESIHWRYSDTRNKSRKVAAKFRLKISHDKAKIMVVHQQDNIRNKKQIKVGDKTAESVGWKIHTLEV